jgi:glycosyltransferase involved in cell wall biosynthesis
MRYVVSVILPVHNRANYIARAIESILTQKILEWELIVVDDGSTDQTQSAVAPYLIDPRIRYCSLGTNRGMGVALNYGLDLARADLVGYLPSDDVYYPEHLRSLAGALEDHPGAVLAYSGLRHYYNRYSTGQIANESLQLVQVVHRKTSNRWLEREELVTDDLERMFWHSLRAYGEFIGTGEITCEWVCHPHQRHKLLREPEGGVNRYRSFYQVKHPLRFHTTRGNYTDEVEHYRQFRERRDTPPSANPLKILLVGELAYNPERVLALEERGHKLYGLWIDRPYWYNTVGPLPFGHVEDIPRSNWAEQIRRIEPDIIYALLNWQAVPFAREVLMSQTGVPFVWHFKEGPFICFEKGTWSEMIDLYRYSNGIIHSSLELMHWLHTVLPSLENSQFEMVLDGDLPKKEWFQFPPSALLSEKDREFHTVVPGRPIGLHPPDVQDLAKNGIHLHFYGDFTHGQWLEWIDKTSHLAPDHLHLHSQVDQENWVTEFSQYDAGWLHFFESKNKGEIRKATWDDLNYPARIATYVAAGLPLLQRDNSGSIVASQSLARQLDIGLFFTRFDQLAAQLSDRQQMQRLRESVWEKRFRFTFDAHADDLIAFFRSVIAGSENEASVWRKKLCTPSESTPSTTIRQLVW